MAESEPAFVITANQVAKWRAQFYESPVNRLAQNVCTFSDPIKACLRTPTQLNSLPQPSQEPDEESSVGKATRSGPSWICAGLNMLRLPFIKQLRLPEFEFSTAYLLYWHKLERCNYFLHSVAELLERCEPLDGRTFRYLMKHSIPDGGNWQMFVNLVLKYGVMPKQCYLVSKSASRTLQMNKILRSKLHECASQMHEQFTFDGNASNLSNLINDMMPHLYKVINICMGAPPFEFTWTYYDHKKRYQSLEDMTALDFYEVLVKPHFELGTQICLGHDPRISHSYQRNYRVAFSSNMVGGQSQTYNNQPMETIMQIVLASLKSESPVWLACDLQTRFNARTELLSLTTYNFELVFGLQLGTGLNKAERLLYRDTRRDAALLLTEVTLDAQEQPLQFRTISTAAAKKDKQAAPTTTDAAEKEKKSEDKESAKRAALKTKAAALTADWLREFGFEIVVQSQFVPPEVLHALQSQPTEELPIWDPMGALLS